MEKFDHLFINITQEAQGLEGLFNSLFSFLLRRTDFFYESDPGDNMGFPPGVNEKMLLNIFNRYRDQHYKNSPKKSLEEYATKYVQYAKKNNLPLPPGLESEKQKKSENPPKLLQSTEESKPEKQVLETKVEEKVEKKVVDTKKAKEVEPECIEEKKTKQEPKAKFLDDFK